MIWRLTLNAFCVYLCTEECSLTQLQPPLEFSIQFSPVFGHYFTLSWPIHCYPSSPGIWGPSPKTQLQSPLLLSPPIKLRVYLKGCILLWLGSNHALEQFKVGFGGFFKKRVRVWGRVQRYGFWVEIDFSYQGLGNDFGGQGFRVQGLRNFLGLEFGKGFWGLGFQGFRFGCFCRFKVLGLQPPPPQFLELHAAPFLGFNLETLHQPPTFAKLLLS